MDTRKNLIAKHFGLRGIAVFEAFKGLLAIMVAIWLLSLLHKDLQNVAEHLLRFLHKLFHLNPDGHLARSIVRGARHVTPNAHKVGGAGHEHIDRGVSGLAPARFTQPEKAGQRSKRGSRGQGIRAGQAVTAELKAGKRYFASCFVS